MKPSFLIVGEMKCGTTSLYRYLERHPDVRSPFQKEPFYFAHAFHRGERWYRSLFPLARESGITGEASTYYLFHPLAAERIAAFAPEIKLIVLLRDPVTRAHSHYQHSRDKGREPDLTFEEALAAEPDRIGADEARIVGEPGFESFAHMHYSYVARGRYAEGLERLYRHFPREQVLVLAAEDLFADPASVARRATDFLGLAPADLAPYRAENTRQYEVMEDSVQARLREAFAEPNARLARLLGRDFGWL